jgi:hypothetical protein
LKAIGTWSLRRLVAKAVRMERMSRRSTALGDVNLTPESAGESLKTPEPPSPAGKEALRTAGLNGLKWMPNKSALPIRFVSIRRATGEPG